MMFFWLIKEAFLSLWRHKFRSFLAILGVVVGIVAVAVLMSVGNGVKADVTKSIEGIGSNLIVIVSGKINTSSSGGFNQGSVGNPANFVSGDILKREDVEAIQKISEVKAVAPITLVPGSIRKGEQVSMATPTGATPDLAEIFTGFKIKYGRFIEDADDGKQVLVTGDAVRKQLFSDRDNIVGEKVMLGTDEFEIIGQLEKPAEAGAIFSSDYDSIAIMPFETAKRLNGGEDKIMRIGAVARDAQKMNETKDLIQQDMLKRHKEDEFSVLTQEDLLGLMNSVIELLTSSVAAIAAVSLIVGGIGISSVMFMSVADRTREIGVRKAIGATSGWILFQFLVESVILAIFGGVLGLAAAWLVNYIIDLKTVIHPAVTPGIIYLALGFCMGVGVIFGLIPAVRGARKDPVDALREG